jgi:hypothetical protein
MKLRLSVISMLFFMLSVLFLVLLTLFEASLAGLSVTTERALTLLLLVAPAVLGIAFGILSLLRKETKPWLAILGLLLNGLFGLFHIALLAFAG